MQIGIKYWSDDIHSSMVGLAIGRKIMPENFHVHPDGRECILIDDKDVQTIIGYGIKNGLLRLHMELGELYYHPTVKGYKFIGHSVPPGMKDARR